MTPPPVVMPKQTDVCPSMSLQHFAFSVYHLLRHLQSTLGASSRCRPIRLCDQSRKETFAQQAEPLRYFASSS